MCDSSEEVIRARVKSWRALKSWRDLTEILKNNYTKMAYRLTFLFFKVDI